MRLEHLVKPIEEMTDEELLERLHAVRHRREVAKPVAKKKAQVAATKQSRKKVIAAEKLLEGLSPEQLDALLKEMGQ